MRMKQMVEVKNAWKNEENLMNDRSAKKKMHMKIMGVEPTVDLIAQILLFAWLSQILDNLVLRRSWPKVDLTKF